MKINPMVLGCICVVVILIAIKQQQYSSSASSWEVMAEQDKQLARLRRELGNLSRLRYLAVAYGKDARVTGDRRLLPLDHFALSLEERPVWIQADDALIQVLREGDSLRVDAWHVVTDTTLVYFDKELFPPKDTLQVR